MGPGSGNANSLLQLQQLRRGAHGPSVGFEPEVVLDVPRDRLHRVGVKFFFNFFASAAVHGRGDVGLVRLRASEQHLAPGLAELVDPDEVGVQVGLALGVLGVERLERLELFKKCRGESYPKRVAVEVDVVSSRSTNVDVIDFTARNNNKVLKNLDYKVLIL